MHSAGQAVALMVHGIHSVARLRVGASLPVMGLSVAQHTVRDDDDALHTDTDASRAPSCSCSCSCLCVFG